MIPSDDSTSQKEVLERVVEPSPPAQFRFPVWGETIWYNHNRNIIGKPLGYGAFGAVYECVDDWGIAAVSENLVGRLMADTRLGRFWASR